jgi:dipeptidase D
MNESLITPLDFFFDISKIPRKSGDEREISDYLVRFAQEHNFEHLRDRALNVYIKKPATEDCKQASPLILQAHMDMVYEAESSQYPYGEPLRIRKENRFLYAEGTSLGADNGIGMAYILALLADTGIPHPPLETIFTSREEDGLIGASLVKEDWFTGKSLINLDGEDEDVLTVGCAGAFRGKLKITGPKLNPHTSAGAVHVSLTGLSGGHSGLRIGEEGGNALRLLARILYFLYQKFDMRISAINGGKYMNSIPAHAEAIICIDEDKLREAEKDIFEFKKQLAGEIDSTDPNFSITATQEKPEDSFDRDTTFRILSALLLLPNGPLSMSKNFPGVVETSSNIGIVETTGESVTIISNPRSSMRSHKQFMSNQIEILGKLLTAQYEPDSDYPAWEYSPVSPLRTLYSREYFSLFGKQIKTLLLHGGLECGILSEKFHCTDAISIGPAIFDVHSVKERVDIDSVERVWKCLKTILVKWPHSV